MITTSASAIPFCSHLEYSNKYSTVLLHWIFFAQLKFVSIRVFPFLWNNNSRIHHLGSVSNRSLPVNVFKLKLADTPLRPLAIEAPGSTGGMADKSFRKAFPRKTVYCVTNIRLHRSANGNTSASGGMQNTMNDSIILGDVSAPLLPGQKDDFAVLRQTAQALSVADKTTLFQPQAVSV